MITRSLNKKRSRPDSLHVINLGLKALGRLVKGTHWGQQSCRVWLFSIWKHSLAYYNHRCVFDNGVGAQGHLIILGGSVTI